MKEPEAKAWATGAVCACAVGLAFATGSNLGPVVLVVIATFRIWVSP